MVFDDRFLVLTIFKERLNSTRHNKLYDMLNEDDFLFYEGTTSYLLYEHKLVYLGNGKPFEDLTNYKNFLLSRLGFITVNDIKSKHISNTQQISRLIPEHPIFLVHDPYHQNQINKKDQLVQHLRENYGYKSI